MSFAIDGTPVNVVSGSSITSLALPAMSSTFGSGKVVVHIALNGTTVSSVTGGGLTFTKLFAGQLGSGGTPANSCEVWTANVGSALSSTVFTVNYAGTATFSALAGACFSNGGTGSISFDAGGPTSGNGATSAITTVNANTIVIGYTRYTATANPALGSGWSSIMSGVAGSYSMHEYLPEATTGTYTPPSSAGDLNSSITYAIYVGAGFTPKQRKTLSPNGTRIGSRQIRHG